MKLHVGNLPAGTSDADLAELFRPFGVVTAARVTTSMFFGQSRNIGIVEMLRECGELAMSQLDGQQIDCMVLRVHEAQSRVMKKISPSRSITFACLVGLQLVSGFPDLALAQAVADNMPENAAAKRYGGGWRCNTGYRESNGACATIDIPENGFATDSSFGAGWECSYGFKETNGTCTAVRVPANAYLDPVRGDSWKCNRGYRVLDNNCVFVDVPANGYLKESTYGPSWECERGYRADGGGCIAVQVPENGYPTYAAYGSGWECRRGYRELDGACNSISVPAHGYLMESSRGTGWACERGFRADGDQCVELSVPENAHLDYSGNDWDCNKPYSKRSGRCIPPTSE